MARSRKPKRPKVSPKPVEHYLHPRPPVPVPEWFEAPTSFAVSREWRDQLKINNSRVRAYGLVEAMRQGHLALPPWQRGEVWTEDQQVGLLDSLMRGISVGPITCLIPDRDLGLEPRPFDGCLPSERPRDGFVLDGQQRLTTLLRAANGELDHWRWSGCEWTRGRGILRPSEALEHHGRHSLDFYTLLCQQCDEDVVKRIIGDWVAVSESDFAVVTMAGPIDLVVESYRRMATMGAAHSPEDLEHLERWLADQGGWTITTLTRGQVIEIRARQGIESAQALADLYGVTATTIRSIWARRSWKDV